MRNLLHNLGMAACFSATTAFGQIEWTPTYTSTSDGLETMIWSHNQLFALTGRDTLLTSPDGVAWTKSWTNCPLSAVTWAGGRYVAVGNTPYDSPRRSTTGAFFGSPDGRSWTLLDQDPSRYSNNLNDIIWADTQFVAVGEPSSILTSPDGESWIRRTPIPNVVGSYNSVAWTGGLLVVVGVDQGIGVDRSAVLTSPDGVKWETRTTDGKNALSDVVWTGNQLVAVGNKGTILTSPDGTTWTSRNSGTNNWLRSVVWTGHQLVAVGVSSGGPPVILTSPDGGTWTNRIPAQHGFGSCLAWTGQLLVAVGENRFIVTSPEDPSSVRPGGSLSRDFKISVRQGEIRYALPEFAQGRYASASVYALSGQSIFSQVIPPGREGRLPVHPLAQGKYLFELQADGKSFSRLFEISR
jgi:hypothetical protein